MLMQAGQCIRRRTNRSPGRLENSRGGVSLSPQKDFYSKMAEELARRK